MNLSYDPPPSTIGGPWSHTYDNDLGGDSASAFVGSGSGSESELRRAQSPVEDVRRLWTKQARNNGPGENMNAYARLSAPRPSYRRALSAGALPTLSSAAINFPSHDQLPTPAPSLFSPPLTAVSVDGHAVEASGSAFAAAQERFLNNQPPPQRTQYPPNTSPGSHSFFLPSPTNFPPSPGSHTAHLRQQLLEREEDHPGRRTRSSHLPFVPNASLSGAHTGAGSRHTPRSLSIAVPSPSASASYSASAPFSAPTIPQSSSHYPSNDVQQLLSDIHEMLGPETIAALSPPHTRRTMQRSEPPSSPLSRHRVREPHEPRRLLEYSGVLLDPEDMDMMAPSIDRPPSPPYREAYGPRPTFDQPPSPVAPHSAHRYASGPAPYQPRPTNNHPHLPPDESSYYFSPPMSDYDRSSLRHPFASQSSPHRPRSAPASPELGSGGFSYTDSHYQPDSYASALPSSMPHEVRHRRGSSVDGFLMQDHDGHHKPAPIEQYSQVYPITPTRQSFALRMPNSAPSLGARRPSKARKSGAGKGLASMFVNFSASDANALLSGVAPSGSSKRKREEEEERCRREVRPAV